MFAMILTLASYCQALTAAAIAALAFEKSVSPELSVQVWKPLEGPKFEMPESNVQHAGTHKNAQSYFLSSLHLQICERRDREDCENNIDDDVPTLVESIPVFS